MAAWCLTRGGGTSAAIILLVLLAGFGKAQDPAVPDLARVRGIEHFGNEQQRAVLQRLGFVVVPRWRGTMHSLGPLPPLVTVDVAFHGMAAQMRSMMEQVERALAPVLRRFTERGLRLALAGIASEPALLDVARFLALGRWAHRDGWEPDGDQATVRELVESDHGPWAVLPRVQVAPGSAYDRSQELVAYFRARDWFSARVFDMTQEEHARTARALHRLIADDPELRRDYDLLRAPFELWLGPTTMPALDVPPPAAGWCALLPPRELPCAVALERAAAVRSALPTPFDVLVLGPLQCEAGIELARLRNPAALIDELAASPLPPAPRSLYQDFLAALASVHAPLPAHAPAVFAQAAWRRRLCETQLGAWATVREIVALHAAPRVIGGREGEPAPGRVAPYPHTFAAVAAVARGLLGLLDDFDRQIAPARPARDLASALRNGGDVRWRLDYAQDLCPDFDLRGTADRQAEALRRLAAIAAKQGSGEALTAAEGDFLRTLSSDRCELRWGLLHVARTCDRFAAVARRQLEGEPLTEDDSALLQNVDRQIADMLAQESSAFRPVVTPVAAHPDGRSVLWMGIAYPAAVYVVLDDAGTPSLFCGAVYDVRALVRPGSAPALTNREWERSCSRPPRATSRDASAPTTAIPEFGMYR